MTPSISIQRSLGIAALALGLSSFSSQLIAAEQPRNNKRHFEYARVLNVQPVYREIQVREPRQECWTEQEQHIVGYQNRSPRHFNSRRAGPNRQASQGPRNSYRNQIRNSHAGNAVIGGIIGGVIGNQLGRGHSRHSRTGATVVGAIIGSAIGNESHYQGSRIRDNRRGYGNSRGQTLPIYETRNVQRCKQVIDTRTDSQLQHYRVTYEHLGRQYVTQTQRDPGNRIEVQVSVSPARR